MHSNPLISVARSKASALFAALALVLVVTLTLAGCSSDKSEETATEAKKTHPVFALWPWTGAMRKFFMH